ncbi:serine/threonine-protein kinase [Sorangium sp. So ce1036]|uniref:serine/threonine-protein kinase n=1 Tax=Sorangium sp. So ce1036 TaxID=3133328 RepID=UPI003F078933
MTIDGFATRDDETRAFSQEERSFSRGELPSGARAGEYIVGYAIARGGCGAVYEARHSRTGARVAMKVLHGTLAASPKMVKRFLREVEVVRLLKHPGIVEIYDAGELADGRPFYVMEHLDGVTLDVLLREEGRLSPEQALDLLEPVCSALEAAHTAGIIHRDVKGSNIFVTRSAPRAVKLLDFGIAKLMEPDAGATGFTTAGRAPGTLTIMAPEQILGGAIDARVDVYALGVLLHRLLTGKLPFYSPDATELLRQHLEEPPPRPSRRTPLPPALDAVVLRCLEKQPEHRFASVKSFLCTLREAVGEPASGRSSLPDVTVDAIAVYLDLRARFDEDDLDDLIADELGRVLDLAEERLRSAGLTLVSTTGNEILAVRQLSFDPEEAQRGREEVLEAAVMLQDEIAQTTRPDARVHVNLCLHAGPVTVRSMLNPEIIGGALAQVGSWAPVEDVHGLCATEEAVRGISGFELAAGPPGLVLVAARPLCPPPSPTLRCGPA